MLNLHFLQVKGFVDLLFGSYMRNTINSIIDSASTTNFDLAFSHCRRMLMTKNVCYDLVKNVNEIIE